MESSKIVVTQEIGEKERRRVRGTQPKKWQVIQKASQPPRKAFRRVPVARVTQEMCDLPLCRQFLCTHCNLRTCYRRAEKRCWVRDSCKPPGYTSPRLLPPRLPANPPFTLSFTHALPLFPSLCSVFHPLAPLHVRCSPPRGFLLSFFYDHFPGWLFGFASILFGSTLFLHPPGFSCPLLLSRQFCASFYTGFYSDCLNIAAVRIQPLTSRTHRLLHILKIS